MIRRLARRAMTLFLLALTVLSGVVGLLLPVAPNNVSSPFPHWAQVAWSGGLLIGGVIAISGIVVDGVRGLYVERAGLFILAGLSFCVAFAAISYLYSPYDWIGVGSVGAFGLCCAARAGVIGEEARDKALVQMARELNR